MAVVYCVSCNPDRSLVDVIWTSESLLFSFISFLVRSVCKASIMDDIASLCIVSLWISHQVGFFGVSFVCSLSCAPTHVSLKGNGPWLAAGFEPQIWGFLPFWRHTSQLFASSAGIWNESDDKLTITVRKLGLLDFLFISLPSVLFLRQIKFIGFRVHVYVLYSWNCIVRCRPVLSMSIHCAYKSTCMVSLIMDAGQLVNHALLSQVLWDLAFMRYSCQHVAHLTVSSWAISVRWRLRISAFGYDCHIDPCCAAFMLCSGRALNSRCGATHRVLKWP